MVPVVPKQTNESDDWNFKDTMRGQIDALIAAQKRLISSGYAEEFILDSIVQIAEQIRKIVESERKFFF
jgi:hypothetical protein